MHHYKRRACPAFGNKRGLFEAAVTFYIDQRITLMLGGLEADDAEARAEVLSMLALGAFVRVRGAEPDRSSPGLATLVRNTMASWG